MRSLMRWASPPTGHGSAGTGRDGPAVRRHRTRIAGVAMTAIVGAVVMPLGATSASAALDPNAAPEAPHAITVFPARDFVTMEGYNETDVLTVEVWRGGVKVGTTAEFSPDPTGFAEINHAGPPCWSGVTPDIRGNDVVRVLTSPTTGDQVPTADVIVTQAAAKDPLDASTVIVKGIAMTAAGGQFPIDQLQARLVNPDRFANGRRTLRADSSGFADGTFAYDGATTNWTATFSNLTPGDADLAVAAESRGMWLGRVAGAFNEVTIYEAGVAGGPAAGCNAPASPTPSVPDMTTATDTGSSALDNITRNASPTFVGTTGDPAATDATLYVDNLPNGTAAVAAGNYSLTPATALAAGPHTVIVGETTAPAANEAFSTRALSITIDTLAPAAPTVTGTTPASPGGSSTPSVMGTVEAGSMVSLYSNATCIAPTAASDTAAIFASPGISATVAAGSTTSFSATATDVAGNASPCSNSVSYRQGTPPPPPPPPPVNVVTVPGRAQIGLASSGVVGGRITATARWARPASNGGSAITGYVVTAIRLNANGTVRSRTVSAVKPASQRSLRMTLRAGKYRFTVRTRNAIGWGANSARSNRVSAR